MNDAISIRRMSVNDKDVLNFLLEQYAYLITTYQPKTDLPKALLKHKHFVIDHLDNYFVALANKTFVGVFDLILQGNYYLITDIYVKSDDRSRGFGSIILDKCKAKARYDSKDLRVIIDKTNIRGCRFFERNNFENIGESGGMYIYQLALAQLRDEESAIKRGMGF